MTRNSIKEEMVGEEFNRKQAVASRELNCSEAKGIRKKTWFTKFPAYYLHTKVYLNYL